MTTAVAPTVDADRVAALRAFTRSYTALLGVLDEGLLHSPYSVTEARVIFELAQREVTHVADLRRDLGIDAGYMSRITARLEADGLVRRERSDTDARRQVLRLTEQGRAVFDMLDARAAEQAAQLLADMPDPVQRRVVAAMDTIRAAFTDGDTSPSTVVLRAPAPGDLGWVVARHGALYASEYGWDETFEGLVARIVGEFAADHDPRREAGVDRRDRRRTGGVCVLRRRRRDHGAAPAPAGRAHGTRATRRSPARRRVRPVRAARRLPVDRPVDQRRARVCSPDLRGRRLHSRRRGTSPQLRPRPGRPALVARALSRPLLDDAGPPPSRLSHAQVSSSGAGRQQQPWTAVAPP